MDSHPFTRLTPDLVMDAVESVGYRCDARILELNSYENRVYQIGIEDEAPLIGKFYRPGRWSDEQIIEEHDFTLELAEGDISAVPPIKLVTGRTLEHFDTFRFALYPRRGGRAPDLDNLDNLEILGRHIGRIHSVGAGTQYQHRPALSLDEYAYASRTFLVNEGFIPQDLRNTYEMLTDTLLERMGNLFNDVAMIRLHGDCHMGNVLWRDDLPHFVDFDDSRSGPAVQDLWMMLSGEHDARSIQIEAIIEGYRTFYDFNPAELRLIEPLRTLRIMYHACWIARRWDDPAFPRAFPFFDNYSYWAEHLQQLREQLTRLEEPSLRLFNG